MQSKSFNAEYAVVGSFLKGGLTTKAREVLNWLEPEMFKNYKLALTYTNIRKQALRDNLIDILMLSEEFGEDFSMLAEIVKNTTAYSNLSGYAERVKSLWSKRTAMKAMLEAHHQLSNARTDEQAEDILNKALLEIQHTLSENQVVRGYEIPELLNGYLDLIEQRRTGKKEARLLKTGVQAIDDIVTGFNPTDLIIIAGQSGQGKTQTALMITESLLQQGKSGLFFSLEMDKSQIVERLISDIGHLNSTKLRNPIYLNDDDWEKILNAHRELLKQNLCIVDQGGLTTNEIKYLTQQRLDEGKLIDFIMIDYAELIRSLKTYSRPDLELVDIVKDLKDFAKEIYTPIFLLSQVNRDTSKRANKRPTNQNLSGSSILEKTASQILMIYNERAINPNSNNPYAEIIVTKNRFGGLGTAYFKFEKGKFLECDQRIASEEVEQIGSQKANVKSGVNF
ncbi:DnaB-like helicase C-terminal domain-containing protein [Phocoenobacter skyensis]|uniref:DNA 5'-3' helicase n=1 Tax=Phocoenobacter skyensis TaxID=97481 RepID=A0A1H7XJW1_9PAST|nr:DnaB-like helicase C-terminal domain-containing protein [Pasteurella skyensis]MDP8184379.1 DnaB-like helicase C-terminal domain-containing protein [Pasteurella skyensis]QLB22617.1 hypothetical protein A6B44_05115 [Pasteurella skyensis]SEM34212.1 replicative DNA helicase [Pasteurella skyensis]